VSENPVVIRVDDVSKRFILRKEKSLKERLVNFGRSNRHKEDFWALRNVNLDITAGTTIGLIGPNGSGKSTLLKTIAGIIQPTSGEVRRRGRLAALLELGAGFHPDLTGRENVYLNASILGLSREETDSHFNDIVEFSGIGEFIDTQVKFYSSGMYVRLAFAVAVHVDPDILIVDEVLAVGDEPFQRKCMDRIRAFQKAGKTIVLVTHSLDIVGEICDRAVVLEHGHVVFDGEPAKALARLRDDFEDMRQTAAIEEGLPASDHIRSVHVRSAGGALDRTIVPGEEIEIEVALHVDTEVKDWIVGIGIHTPLGQTLFGTNTELLKSRNGSVDGDFTVSFHLSAAWIADGQYYVSAAFARDEIGELDRVDQGAVINVRGDRRAIGVLGVPEFSSTLLAAVTRAN
jgi:ABC-2 type transport system ATP-binding protein